MIGCRGNPSKRTPIHLNPNMDYQPKYKPQSESKFFENGAAMRTPRNGTVARSDLRDDIKYYSGMDEYGKPVNEIQIPVTMQVLERGQDRFNIYCSPCHSRVGDGKGIMTKYGFVPPANFHDERIRNMSPGESFNVITNGIRNMPSYAQQIPMGDRWVIVAYIQALLRSQNAVMEDIPTELRDKIK